MYVPDTISDEELARMLEQGPNVIGPGPYALAREVRQLRDAARLTSNPAGKVAGYTAQPDAKVALVNEFKADEERLLRKLDRLAAPRAKLSSDKPLSPGEWAEVEIDPIPEVDGRWLAIARTHFQEGFMALNRAVFQPQRIKLPEDGE